MSEGKFTVHVLGEEAVAHGIVTFGEQFAKYTERAAAHEGTGTPSWVEYVVEPMWCGGVHTRVWVKTPWLSGPPGTHVYAKWERFSDATLTRDRVHYSMLSTTCESTCCDGYEYDVRNTNEAFHLLESTVTEPDVSIGARTWAVANLLKGLDLSPNEEHRVTREFWPELTHIAHHAIARRICAEYRKGIATV